MRLSLLLWQRKVLKKREKFKSIRFVSLNLPTQYGTIFLDYFCKSIVLERVGEC